MPILWCGGEDIDFPTGGAATVTTTAAFFRSGYARCTVQGNAVYLHGNPFPGGAVTSCWLTFRGYAGAGLTINTLFAGLVSSATASTGLWVGSSSASATRLALFTYNGTTKTQLAAEVGNSFPTVTINRIDVQLVNYGGSATVNVYCNGTLVITFSGDVTVGGLTNVNCVGLSPSCGCSELIVADEDLRGFPGLLTMALTSDGTTTDWTGVYSTINGTTISDATPNYTNASNLEQEFNITDPPTGVFNVRAVKLAARAAKAAGTPTQIALGYNEGGTVTVGADRALGAAYGTIEQLDTVNPRTALDWGDQSVLTSLQIDARSKA